MQDLFFEYRDTRTLLRSQGFRISSQNTGIQDLHLEYRDTGSPLRIQGYIQDLRLEYRDTESPLRIQAYKSLPENNIFFLAENLPFLFLS